ncbi:MAG: tryptophan--tRNA ligase [bacterium]|nr:tryptophan--tRNA ligase [bacterium]
MANTPADKKASGKETVFSGIKPTARPHLGNYLGMIKQAVALQESYQCIYGVVDLHAITKPQKPEELTQNTRDIVLDLLALGIDPERSILFVQSHVPAHSELAWIFNSITPISWLDRLGPYKEETAVNSQLNQVGILDYPVLMTADILLYKATCVPVGEDQLPHIDVANEIAKRFNHLFGKTFDPIKPLLTEAKRIMSLAEPKKKMSKSGDAGISLGDSADEIRKKIKRAVTDSGSEIRYSPGAKPAVSNLLTIYGELSGKPVADIEKMYAGKGYADFKNDLAQVVADYFADFRARRAELQNDRVYVSGVLADGAARAAAIADKTLKEVKAKMGFLM